HREKIAALLYELPKSERRELGDIPSWARDLAAELTPFKGSMLEELAKAVNVDQKVFRHDAIAHYLQLNIRIVDEGGNPLARGRDVEALMKQYGARARAAWQKAAPAPEKPRTGFTTWNFGDLAPFVLRTVGNVEVRSYPAIVDRGNNVDLEDLESSTAA